MEWVLCSALFPRPLRFAPLDGVLDQFGGVAEVQFLFDVGAMGFDSLDAEVKFFGDLPSAVALADETEHFELPIAQVFDR